MQNKEISSENLYISTAFLYDFDNRDLLNYDVELCLKYINQTRGDILEMACDTGRITIPVLENAGGRSVTAFDLSDTMLEVFREKISSSAYMGNLRLEKANMADFDFSQKFGLIILVWRAFQCLINEEDAKSCLQCVKNHMDASSIFLFSIFLPRESYGADWLGKENISYEAADPQTGNEIKRWTKNLKSDEEAQVIEYASIYEITGSGGNKNRLEDRITCKYYYPEQIKQLLADCGFTVVMEYTTDTDLFLTLKAEGN